MTAGLGRGDQRLEIARKLAALPEGADVMRHIESMPPREREHLRGLVDWVEEYEIYEMSLQPAQNKRAEGVQHLRDGNSSARAA